MSYLRLKENIETSLPQSQVRFLFLVNREIERAQRQLQEERGRPVPLVFRVHTPALDSLDLVDDEIAAQSPKTAFLFLLNRLDASRNEYNIQLLTAIEFLSLTFLSSYPETEMIRRKVKTMMRQWSRQQVEVVPNNFRTLMRIYLERPRFININNLDTELTEMRRICRSMRSRNIVTAEQGEQIIERVCIRMRNRLGGYNE